MNRKLIFIIGLVFIYCQAQSQKYISKSSSIRFYSSAPLEDIEAVNEKARSVFDSETGEIVFTMPISGFEFEKSLMQEHFNEKYMESDKFPKATFSGKLNGFKIGETNENVVATGTMEIHGVKNDIEVTGSLNYLKDQVVIDAVFMIKVADYDVEIPSLLFQNIAEEVEVTVKFEYKPYEK